MQPFLTLCSWYKITLEITSCSKPAEDSTTRLPGNLGQLGGIWKTVMYFFTVLLQREPVLVMGERSLNYCFKCKSIYFVLVGLCLVVMNQIRLCI